MADELYPYAINPEVCDRLRARGFDVLLPNPRAMLYRAHGSVRTINLTNGGWHCSCAQFFRNGATWCRDLVELGLAFKPADCDIMERHPERGVVERRTLVPVERRRSDPSRWELGQPARANPNPLAYCNCGLPQVPDYHHHFECPFFRHKDDIDDSVGNPATDVVKQAPQPAPEQKDTTQAHKRRFTLRKRED